MNEAFLPPKRVLFDTKDTGIYRNAGVSMRVYPDLSRCMFAACRHFLSRTHLPHS